MLKYLSGLKAFVRQFGGDETGSLPEMTWVIGAALVVAAIIVFAFTFAPNTVRTFWDAATNYIRTQFGF